MSLARITTVQSQKSITFDTIMVDDTIIDPPQDEVLEKGSVVNPEDDYEGIHNRGWICAMGSFMINFFVSGSTLTFGNYMNKQVFNHPIPFLHPWQTRVLECSWLLRCSSIRSASELPHFIPLYLCSQSWLTFVSHFFPSLFYFLITVMYMILSIVRYATAVAISQWRFQKQQLLRFRSLDQCNLV